MGRGTEIPEVRSFLPEEATLTKQMVIDFSNGREPKYVVLAYETREEEGFRILKPGKSKAWKLVYKEAIPVDNGGDELILHSVKGANGTEGLVVVYYYSGAGTSTDWKVVMEANGKIITREAAPMRDAVLKKRHLVFGGYNGVVVENDLIIETIAGYSLGVARCCPDKPSIEMRVKFTGMSLSLDSVGERKTP